MNKTIISKDELETSDIVGVEKILGGHFILVIV